MRARRTAAVAVLALGLGVAPLAHSAPALGTTRLANTVVPNLAAAHQVGAVPAAQRLQVVVALARPHEAAERTLAAAIYTPGSASYHRFLTPEEYAGRFGVDAATYRQTVRWLTRNGMKVAYSSPDRAHIGLAGTAAQAERTFDVALSDYRVGAFVFRAHPRSALVPSSVVAVQGLQTASSYRLAPQAAPAAQGGPCIQNNCMGALTPADLEKVYGMPNTLGSKGSGVRAAVIGEGKTSTAIAGLRKFEAANGRTRPVPTRSVFVANDKTMDDGAGEWQIDSQAILGMAPDLQELSFYMAQDITVVSNAISAWVNDPLGPSIANMSIGGCEALNLALGSPLVDEPLLRQGAMEGRTLFVSTGDTGGSCAVFGPVNLNGVENTGVPSGQWPSTSEFVVGVGGTVLYTKTAGGRSQEFTWTHSGGGTSSFIPAPSWQKPITEIKAPCSTDYALNPVTSYVPCRGVPDVSALSGDIITNGYTTYRADGTTFSGGGTSLSAPLWAGMWVRVQGATTAPLGLATPLIYRLATSGDLSGLEDIAVGTNVQWQAQPRVPVLNPTGWDYTNGLGTPLVTVLAQTIAGGTAAARTNPPSPSPLDSETTMNPGGGGGGGGTGACAGNGQYSAASGDTIDLGTGAAGDVDLVGASIGRGGLGLSFTARVVDLASTPAVKEFEWLFSYAGRGYELDGTDGMAGTTIRLYDDAAGTFLGTPVGATATFDTATNTATVTFSVAAFDAISGKPPLAIGARLSAVTVDSIYKTGPGVAKAEPGFIIDEIVAAGCPDVVL